jgi:hypothetical protein
LNVIRILSKLHQDQNNQNTLRNFALVASSVTSTREGREPFLDHDGYLMSSLIEVITTKDVKTSIYVSEALSNLLVDPRG